MRFLLIPGNNSLSHIAKCLALSAELTPKGHKVLIAVSKANACFIAHASVPYAILPDIQESDHGAAPSIAWFRDTQHIAQVIQAEMNLMQDFRPDRVLGVFRFTTKIAAARAGIAFDSLICGCMLPDNQEALGFALQDEGAQHQIQYINNFFRLAGNKIQTAAGSPTMDDLFDVRQLLEGERTFLWDFPEFMPVANPIGRYHVGPIQWRSWPEGKNARPVTIDHDRPNVVISFGTCCADHCAAQKLTDCLLEQGFNLLIAAGNQTDLLKLSKNNGRIQIWPFIPLQRLLPHASMVISHGGQMTLFESLQYNLPIFVLPFQPEQAHNGVCLERIGCGRRLVPSVTYRGDSRVYTDAFMQHTPSQINHIIASVLDHPDTPACLFKAQQALNRYTGAAMLADYMIDV